MRKITLLEYGSLIYFLCRGAFLGITMALIIDTAMQDAWIGTLIGSIIGIIPVLIFYYIFNKYPNKNIFEINKSYKLGTLFNIIFIIFVIFLVLVLFWNLTNFVSYQILYDTPEVAIGISLLIPMLFTLSKDLPTLGKSCLTIFFIVFLFFIIEAFGLGFQINFQNIKPIMTHDISSIMKVAFFVIAYNVLPLLILSSIPKKCINVVNFKKVFLFFIIGQIAIFIIIFFVISIFGFELASLYQYPEFHLIKRVELLGFVTRTESILSIEWIVDTYVLILLCLYFIKTGFSTYFKKSKLFITIIGISCCIGSTYLFKNRVVAIDFFKDILPIFIYVIFLVIPIVSFIIIKSLHKNVDSIGSTS